MRNLVFDLSLLFMEGLRRLWAFHPAMASFFMDRFHPNPNLDYRIWGLGRSPGSPKVTSTCEHRCQIEPPGRINPIVLPSSMGTSGPSPLSERSVDSI